MAPDVGAGAYGSGLTVRSGSELTSWSSTTERSGSVRIGRATEIFFGGGATVSIEDVLTIDGLDFPGFGLNSIRTTPPLQ